MRQWGLLAAAGVVFLSASIHGGPLEPRAPGHVEVRPYSLKSMTDIFAGHKHARIIVIGNGATYMGVYVFDASGNCVGADDFANVATRDDLVAEWYPPETGVFGIDFHNFGLIPNRAEVAFP